jgi:hypothetical protein
MTASAAISRIPFSGKSAFNVTLKGMPYIAGCEVKASRVPSRRVPFALTVENCALGSRNLGSAPSWA